jgi:hypothetical protein
LLVIWQDNETDLSRLQTAYRCYVSIVVVAQQAVVPGRGCCGVFWGNEFVPLPPSGVDDGGNDIGMENSTARLEGERLRGGV